MGAKKRPFYRFVAIDSRKPRSGVFLDQLGQYVPIEKPAKINIDEEKIFYWLDQGAEPSHTVASLFRQIGLTDKYLAKKAGKDTAGMEVKTTITERPKKRKTKKKAE
jgi:small subunit ribosomal protein S16